MASQQVEISYFRFNSTKDWESLASLGSKTNTEGIKVALQKKLFIE